MEQFSAWLMSGTAWLCDFLWGFPLLILLMGTGVFLMVRLKGLPLRHWFLWQKITLRRFFCREKEKAKKGITPKQAISTALAGTMGTGNIIGVATAISLGGAGAIFWMWVSACLGMAIKYAETFLSVKFCEKEKDRQTDTTSFDGGVGAVNYIAAATGSCFPAKLFALFCVLASFGMGNMAQSNAISMALEDAWRISPAVSGAMAALLLGGIIFGGLKRIAKVSERLIPILSAAYFLGGICIIFAYRERLGDCFLRIFTQAFSVKSAIGGVGGAGILRAMRYGVARGIFSNEAGLGSAGAVYAATEGADAAEAGLWGIFELFVDTIVVCTVTALAVLVTEQKDAWGAFSALFGQAGGWFVSVSVVLFAFASMLGWEYYGETGLRYLTGEKNSQGYRGLFLGAAFLGSISKLELVWNLSEIFNALMALPNLAALWLLSGRVTEGAKNGIFQWKKRRT